MKNWLFWALTVLLATVASAQRITIEKPDGSQLTNASIDGLVKKLMDKAEVTGLCLGIIQHNKIAYVKNYGYRNKAVAALNDTATCFYAASLAKPLFAFLVMQLVDEGKLALDKPLYTYLPKPLPDYDGYKDLAGDDRWKLLTARHCLDHTTGFPNWREFNPNKGKLEIFFTPGQRYAYSGEGLYLLQMVVETITGRSLEELAKEKIFRPFGMRRTSFLWQPVFETDYAVGHDRSEDTLEKNKAVNANAAGSMETTIADYARFVAAVLQGRGLSAASKNEMLSPQIAIHSVRQFPSLNTDTTTENNAIELAYGLGWGLFKSRYGKSFFKEGHGSGWQHYAVAFPVEGYSVILLTNSDNGEGIFEELIEGLTGVTLPYKWEGYMPYRPTVVVPQKVLKQYAGVYDGKLQAIISLEGGRLKVEAETVGLKKTNLYAASERHFFLKVMEVEIEFVKGKDGTVEKIVVDDEGEHYELKRIK